MEDGFQYSGIDGFLGTRGSLMLDVVFVAMFVVLVVMGYSIWLVRYRRLFELHKRIQLTLGAVLVVALSAFEIDMQLLTQWETRAAASPYFPDDYQAAGAKWGSVVGVSLLIHLLCAVPTAVLWVVVIAGALRKFPKPAAPSAYSPRHVFWARLAALGMLLTSITGWIFYWLAFVA
ncbi:MAG: DUF420 domain-containing protein [Planctomycetota bacterium]|nr:DUF420 domain-containing protein [Planctomycetota bacterium]